MHILFLDESGSAPERNKARDTYFVIGGIAVDVTAWEELRRALNQIKTDYQISGEIKWRYFSPHNQKKSNSLVHLSDGDRRDVRNRMFEALIKQSARATAFASITHIEHAYTKKSVVNKDDLYAQTFAEIAARFQFHLQEIGQRGVIVCDHRQGPEDNHLRDFHYELLQNGGVHNIRYNNMVEGLFLAPSHHSVGVQYADLIAGAVYRFAEKSDPQYFDKIRPIFRRSRSGRINGYGIICFGARSWPANAVQINF